LFIFAELVEMRYSNVAEGCTGLNHVMNGNIGEKWKMRLIKIGTGEHRNG
jgi:hypothetical protein